MGVSIILPGGHTSLDASPMEKHYVVLEGEVCIRTPEETVTLGQFDSVRLAPGEARRGEQSVQPARDAVAGHAVSGHRPPPGPDFLLRFCKRLQSSTS